MSTTDWGLERDDILNRLRAAGHARPVVDRQQIHQAFAEHFRRLGVGPLPVRLVTDAEQGIAVVVDVAVRCFSRTPGESTGSRVCRSDQCAAQIATESAAWRATHIATESAASRAGECAAVSGAWYESGGQREAQDAAARARTRVELAGSIATEEPIDTEDWYEEEESAQEWEGGDDPWLQGWRPAEFDARDAVLAGAWESAWWAAWRGALNTAGRGAGAEAEPERATWSAPWPTFFVLSADKPWRATSSEPLSAVENSAWRAAVHAAWRGAWRAAWRASRRHTSKPGQPPPKLYRWILAWLPFVTAYESGLWLFWVLEHEVVAVPRPALRIAPGTAQLHCQDGPAVSWPRGAKYYFWRGVRVPRDVVLRPSRLTVKQITEESNAEVRRVMLERYGPARYLQQVGAVCIHRDETGELYRADMSNDEPLVMVRVLNSTSEPDGSRKEYWLRVPPAMTRAREAVAWTFGQEPETYSPVVET